MRAFLIFVAMDTLVVAAGAVGAQDLTVGETYRIVIAQLFDVYVSVKLQGPSYVEGSQSPNEVRVDRLMLLKVDPDTPPLTK